MKIIHLVLGKANPNRMNGVNKLVFEMLTTQHQLGYDVELWGITPNPVHDYPERIFKTQLYKSQRNKLKLDTRLKEQILNCKKDCVFHLHGSFIPEFYLVTRLLKKQALSYFYTPHGALAPAALNRSRAKKRLYLNYFEKDIIESAAAVIATGVSVFSNLDNIVQVKRKVLIPNGQAVLLANRKPKYIEPLVFGYCGRIAMEHKGLDLLLQGFAKYIQEGGKGELHLIGDGKEMPVFKKLAEQLNVLDRIKLYGAQFGLQKIKLLAEFDVFVHTSRMEGFPAAVLEAAAIGLPLLVSRDTNLWEYIHPHSCGLLVDPNTPERIAEQMKTYEQLFYLEKLDLMSQGAKKMIETHFDWKQICKRLYDEYMLAVHPVTAISE